MVIILLLIVCLSSTCCQTGATATLASTGGLFYPPHPLHFLSLRLHSNPNKLADDMNRRAIKVHNEYRELHHASPLVYDPVAKKLALSWVKHLKDNDKLAYMPGLLKMGYGQNIFKSKKDDDPKLIESAVKEWYKQVNKYNFDKPGYNKQARHFTQLVWRATTHVGCASRAKYVVCLYLPGGNIRGKFYFRQNVMSTDD